MKYIRGATDYLGLTRRDDDPAAMGDVSDEDQEGEEEVAESQGGSESSSPSDEEENVEKEDQEENNELGEGDSQNNDEEDPPVLWPSDTEEGVQEEQRSRVKKNNEEKKKKKGKEKLEEDEQQYEEVSSEEDRRETHSTPNLSAFYLTPEQHKGRISTRYSLNDKDNVEVSDDIKVSKAHGLKYERDSQDNDEEDPDKSREIRVERQDIIEDEDERRKKNLVEYIIDDGGLDYGWKYYAYMLIAQAATLYSVSYVVFMVYSDVSEGAADNYPGRGIPVLDSFAKNSPYITAVTNAVLNPYFQVRFFQYFWDLLTFNNARDQVGLPRTYKDEIKKILASAGGAFPAAVAFAFLDEKLADMISDWLTFAVQNFLGSKEVMVEGVLGLKAYMQEHGFGILKIPPYYLGELGKELRHIFTLGYYPYTRSPHPFAPSPHPLNSKKVNSSEPSTLNPENKDDPFDLREVVKFIKDHAEELSTSPGANIHEQIENLKAALKEKQAAKRAKKLGLEVTEVGEGEKQLKTTDEESPLLQAPTTEIKKKSEFSWKESKTREVTRTAVAAVVLTALCYSIMRIFTLNTQSSMEAEHWFPEEVNKPLTWGISIPCVGMFGMLVAKSVKGTMDGVQDKLESYVESAAKGVEIYRKKGCKGLLKKAKKSLNTGPKLTQFFINRLKEIVALCYLFFSAFSGGTVLGLAEAEGIDNFSTKAATIFITALFNMIGLLFFTLLIIDTISDAVLKTPEHRKTEHRQKRLDSMVTASPNLWQKKKNNHESRYVSFNRDEEFNVPGQKRSDNGNKEGKRRVGTLYSQWNGKDDGSKERKSTAGTLYSTWDGKDGTNSKLEM